MRTNSWAALWVVVYLLFILALGNYSHAWEKGQSLYGPGALVFVSFAGLIGTIIGGVRQPHPRHWLGA
jgi:hypothetical protein